MASNLPDYVASAQPVPKANRVPWYSSTAQTYAGIMLWFVFWTAVPNGDGTPGGTLTQGLGIALAGVVVAALLCHFLYYVVPGMLGLKTGLPLYIVGTSTYGVLGGFLMPGFLMGLLQFGWLGVNAYFAGVLLAMPLYGNDFDAASGSPVQIGISIVWAIAAAFMGLKGIQYVAKVATFFPLIPLTILVVLLVCTVGGIGDYDPQTSIDAAMAAADDEATEAVAGPLTTSWGVFSVIMIYIIGFFATAGAAGTDFGMNNRDAKDVQLGGLVGITGATIFAAGLALMIVAGAHGSGMTEDAGAMDTTSLMGAIMGDGTGKFFGWMLAVAAFPPACFSAFIAANSFKTTLPKVNPFITVGCGTAVSILLAVTGWAGDVMSVFSVIGASFGPICGAMAADYLLSGKKWAGPRASFNPAGWISWAVGFLVGLSDLIASNIDALGFMKGMIPIPPLAAFVVGFALYYLLAKAGLESKTLEMPAAEEAAAE